ncbi:MAG: hypothetical protein ACE5GI_01355 [Candidatus Aminicenantales bacterium]
MRKKSFPNLLAALLVIVIALIAVNIYMLSQLPAAQEAERGEPAPEIPDLVPRYTPVSPPALEGFVPIEVDVMPGIIYLTHNCTEMTMITTESQTYSIDNGIRGVIDPAPLPMT